MTTARWVRLGVTACALAGAVVAGCEQDPYNLLLRPDRGPVDAAGDGVRDGPNDAAADRGFDGDACVPGPLGEICDKKDNDCNGKVDDVPSSQLQTDLKHCGACYNACSFANAFAKCVAGKCVLDKCGPGYHDANGLSSDGCEYACVKSNNGVESCDGLDNDCDKKTDEDFDLTKDLKNCGSCGNACAFSNGTASCTSGTCKLAGCTAGYENIDKVEANGCEYKCPKWPAATTDDCDGVDNDCDGAVDEDFKSAACGNGTGECTQGQTSCVAGASICKGGTQPTAEKCDNKDNDCDGKTDEDFNKLDDPRYCGGCTACSIPSAFAKCNKGTCEIAVCKPGYFDLDKKVSNGCEYACTVTGSEICDGVDNDCNGLVDLSDPAMMKPSGSYCASKGACQGAPVVCKGKDGWQCDYGGDVELRTCTKDADCGGSGKCVFGVCPGVVASQETLCDGLDNNCDGQVDEAFSSKGKACKESGKQGICQGTGTWICDVAHKAVTCDITKPGKAPDHESCNGLDDDCDGQVDEEADDAKYKGVEDDMVHVKATYKGKSYDFYIYAFEASRPDATGSSAGTMTTRACSKPNVIPWANVSFTQAEVYCKAAGKRLCTETEWFLACSGAPLNGPNGFLYPYGDQYKGKNCNGRDYSASSDAVIASGATGACTSPWGAEDMSGNLKEWVDDPSAGAGDPEPVRGGAYDTVAGGLRCDFGFVVFPKTFFYANLGFRCCSNTAP